MSDRASATVIIRNKLGLHARPAMLFVECACRFEPAIRVRRTDQGEWVDGKSVMQLMLLAATEGTEIEVVAEGADAKEPVAALVTLVKSKFQED